MIEKISFSDYVKRPELNMSSLCNIEKSPMHYKWCKDNDNDTSSKKKGRIVHTLVLEPENFSNVYAVEPEKSNYRFVTSDDIKVLCEKYGTKKSGKKEEVIKELLPFITKEEKAQIFDIALDDFLINSYGKEVINQKNYKEANSISSYVLKSPKIQSMLKRGESEISIFQEINGVQMKCRIDFLEESFFLDLKTCQNCSPKAFLYDFIEYQYDVKLAVYQKAIELETGKKIPCIVLAVETSDEHDYKVYNIDQEFLDIGYKKFEAMLETWKECTEKNEWPGMNKSVETLFAPEWYLKNNL